jgi:hypothetical protein
MSSWPLASHRFSCMRLMSLTGDHVWFQGRFEKFVHFLRLGNLEVSWLVRLRNRLVRDHAGLGKIVQLTVGYRMLSHSG